MRDIYHLETPNTHISAEQYDALYQYSIDDPDAFWAEQGLKFIDWFKVWDTVSDWDFNTGKINWFSGGQCNASYNCIDRHLATKAKQTAIIWQGDDPSASKKITYQELHDEVCKLANWLKQQGVKKGDRICIYMPMVPEVCYAMLACARIGAVHSVVFAGFSADALAGRIIDSQCSILITANASNRGGKVIPLKANADQAVERCDSIRQVLVVQCNDEPCLMDADRDTWYHQAVADLPTECPCEVMEANDPLFILYTSGSTGKPKGILHGTAGYLLYAAITHKYTFDYHDGDVFWCTADAGWITGHSYIFYGPLANGGISLMFEGVPNYPDASRFWQIIDQHQVNIFYTAPTAIRALMGAGDHYLESSNRDSLRILGSVGEPINPEAWRWYFEKVGNSLCPIIDTWWQTETGGHAITPLPGAGPFKPGSANKPFFGIEPQIIDTSGQPQAGACEGVLVLARSWPGQMQTIYGDHQRFMQTYFSSYAGKYLTGDGARRDEEGYYWITGRIDDVLNVSGHRLGTAEIESALVLHEKISEAAVVGREHEITGQAIYAYVSVMAGETADEALKKELIELVRHEIGPIATIDTIQWAPNLPKTRSGKIMRRILRKIANKDTDNIGDTSTLADPSIVADLIANSK